MKPQAVIPFDDKEKAREILMEIGYSVIASRLWKRFEQKRNREIARQFLGADGTVTVDELWQRVNSALGNVGPMNEEKVYAEVLRRHRGLVNG